MLVEQDGQERLYFVVETKGSLFDDALRDAESAKIACGKAHFDALDAEGIGTRYVRAHSVSDFSKHW